MTNLRQNIKQIFMKTNVYCFLSRRISRSSHPKVFYKKDVLQNFAKFTAKHLSQSLPLIKLQTWACNFQGCNFIKKRFRNRCFSVNFAKFLRTAFLIKYLWLLLLCFKKMNVYCFIW